MVAITPTADTSTQQTSPAQTPGQRGYPYLATALCALVALAAWLNPMRTEPASAEAWPAGSLAVGSTAYFRPATALYVSPAGNDAAAGSVTAPLRTVAAALKKATAGRTIILRAGTYHESLTIPTSLPGLTIQAYPHEAVWFDGTSAVSGFVKSSGVWVRSNWNIQFSHNASFIPGQYPDGQSPFVGPQNPMAAWPDAVWINDVEQRQVGSKAQVVPGSFFVDYTTHQLILGSDPTGKSVRASDLQVAFMSLAERVTLQGFGVRRYATSLDKLGTIRLQRPLNTLRDLTITENATGGVDVISTHALLDRVTAINNGATGVGGNKADGLIVRSCLFQGNNAQHFNPAPSAAGMKFSRTRGITVYGSVFVNNQANGLWLDESTVGFSIVNNRFAGNTVAGAELELSDTGVFANNVISGGKIGLYIFNTGNVQVLNNSISAFADRGLVLFQNGRRQANPNDPGHDSRYPPGDPTNPWILRNIQVLNNTFSPGAGARYQAYALDPVTKVPADAMNLTFNGNQFSSTPTLIAWGNNNGTATLYRTPAELASAKNKSWRNVQVATPTVTGTAAANAIAVTIPPLVLAKIGLPSGARQTGPFLTQIPG